MVKEVIKTSRYISAKVNAFRAACRAVGVPSRLFYVEDFSRRHIGYEIVMVDCSCPQWLLNMASSVNVIVMPDPTKGFTDEVCDLNSEVAKYVRNLPSSI